jgi:hypothetical protein
MSTSSRHTGEDPYAANASWLFLGAHGGAGTSTLVRYSRRHGYPYATEAPDECARDLPIVAVAGDHQADLRHAQQLAQEGALQGRVAGLVVVAGESRPGRAIEASIRMLGGVFPTVWRIPHLTVLHQVEPAEAVDQPWPPIHPDLAQVLDEVRAAVAAHVTPANGSRF